MKMCKNCDKTYSDEFGFCPKCGGSLIDDTRLRCPKPNVIPGRLLLANDYGRLLIGLMSKVDSIDCLTNEEKRMFAWCIIGSCCSEDDKLETGLSMCSSVNNVVSKYKNYGK